MVFGQESTVVKWNYQILGLHQVTVRQKLGVILGIKVVQFWSCQKMLFTKNSSMKIFFRKIRMIFDIENPKLALFDELSLDGDSKSCNFIWLQLILGQKTCLCQVLDQEIPLPKLI